MPGEVIRHKSAPGLPLVWGTDHVAASDPHTGYRLESADHSHQTAGAQAGQLDHGVALTGLSDNDHPQYLLKQMAENDPLLLDYAISGDGYYSGIGEAGLLGEKVAFGEVVYSYVSNGYWYKAKADATATSIGKIGICLDGGVASDGTTILLWGKVNAASKFPTLTVDAPVYISAATAGLITSTAPTGANFPRIIGYANTGDELFFCPDDIVQVDDTPVDGSTTKPVSSNWAFDHAALTTAHHTKYTDAEAVDAVEAAGLILADTKVVEHDPTPAASHTANGEVVTMTGGVAAGLSFGQACYVGTDGKMELALADDAAITIPATHLCIATIAENAAGLFLVKGWAHDDSWAFDVGLSVYLSVATAGLITKTMPTKVTGNQVQVLGTCLVADTIYWNPSMIVMEYA